MQFLQPLNAAGLASGFHPMQLLFLRTRSGIQGGVDSLGISSLMSRLGSPSPSPLSSWKSWRSGWVHRGREGEEEVGGMGMRK